jgi:ADP-glucose pyrophosphorylase
VIDFSQKNYWKDLDKFCHFFGAIERSRMQDHLQSTLPRAPLFDQTARTDPNLATQIEEINSLLEGDCIINDDPTVSA